jgi:2,5-diketo-D-gluconate reductase A
MSVAPAVKLNDGNALPHIGLGTWPMDDAELARVVPQAVEIGYRLFDSAVNYGNEKGLGDGVRASDVEREELLVTTKVPGRDHGYESTLRSLDESLQRMQLDYVDLYLIHWPNPHEDNYIDTWRAMVDLQKAGKAKSIGVSNFTAEHIDRLIDETGVTPAVNQIQLFPSMPREAERKYHEQQGIVTESWSPLGKGANAAVFGGSKAFLEAPVFTTLAHKYGVTPGQLVLRWHVQQGLVPLPKTANQHRLQQNFDVFGFELDEDDVREIASAGGHVSKPVDSNEHQEF